MPTMTDDAFQERIQHEVFATKVAMQRADSSEREFLVGKLTALLLVQTPNIGNAAALTWANHIWLMLRKPPT